MTNIEEELSIAELRMMLSYEPQTGHLYWIIGGGRRRMDVPAGKLCKDGYRRVGINNKHYAAHRLAWALMTGEYPEDQLDHVNRNRDDNRWENLRKATCQENNCNKGRDPALLGTTFISSIGKWQAQFRGRYLGTFSTAQEANEAYLTARSQA
jgi:hypothetical protein